MSHYMHHIASVGLYVTIFVALMVLTGLTVAVTYVDLGRFNLVVALAIAVFKASLVVLYFMHMRYDKPFNAIVFIAALGFVALFVFLSLMDTAAYQGELIPDYSPPTKGP